MVWYGMVWVWVGVFDFAFFLFFLLFFFLTLPFSCNPFFPSSYLFFVSSCFHNCLLSRGYGWVGGVITTCMSGIKNKKEGRKEKKRKRKKKGC